MKKTVVFSIVASVLLLVGCGSTPEQTYIDALQPALEKVDTMGTILNALGDNLLDENFNEAATTLTQLKDITDEIALPDYAGTNASLSTVETSLQTAIQGTTTLVSTLEPVLAKVAENENAPLTEEDTKAVAEIEGLTKKVSEAMDAAGVAFDAYANEVE